MNAASFSRFDRGSAVLMIVVCFAAVTTNLQRPSFWIDELISFRIVDATSFGQVVANVIDAERRPPGYQVIFWLWSIGAGHIEWSARLFSGVWSVLAAAGTFALARRIAGARAAVVAGLLCVIHPLLISYGQTVRYYTFIAAVAAIAHVALLSILLGRGKLRVWVIHTILMALLLYSDYPAYGVVAAHNLVALIFVITGRKSRRWYFTRWVPPNVLLAAILIPWIPIVLTQSQRDFGTADLANSLSGVLLKLAYPFYAWSIGENLFPWRPIAVMSLIGFGLAFLAGVWWLWRVHKHVFVALIVSFLIPFAFSQVLLNTVASDGPFVNAAARGMAGISIFIAIAAAGIARIRRTSLACAWLAVLLIAHAWGLFNYLAGREFFNPIYNTPAREVAHMIAANASPDDAVISDFDSNIKIYLPPALQATHIDSERTDQILAYIRSHKNATIWQIEMGRDRTRNDSAQMLRQTLLSERRQTAEIGYAPQDETYRTFKSRILKRDAYLYRLTVFKFEPVP